MDIKQRIAAYRAAEVVILLPPEQREIELDADATHNTGFDEVEDGVWVHAWVKVPASMIPGYVMQPPAAPAVVATTSTMNYVQFRTAYISTRMACGDSFTEDDIESSWQSYKRDPAGHFLSRPNP